MKRVSSAPANDKLAKKSKKNKVDTDFLQNALNGSFQDVLEGLNYTLLQASTSKTAADVERRFDKFTDDCDALQKTLDSLEKENSKMFSVVDELLESGDLKTTSRLPEYEYCNFCNIPWKNKRFFYAHMLERHSLNNCTYLACTICHSKHEDLDTFDAHITSHGNDAECGVCGKKDDDLTKHLKDDHGYDALCSLKLTCDFCPYRTNSSTSLQVHCYLCSNNPKNSNYTPTEEGRVCNICQQVFQTNLQMLRHKEGQHVEGRGSDWKRFSCEECGQGFFSVRSLGGHKRKHAKKKGALEGIYVPKTANIGVGMVTKLKKKVEARSRLAESTTRKTVHRSVEPNCSSAMSSSIVEDMPDLETDKSLIGNGSVVFDWAPGSNYLAIGGNNGVICLYDRYGERTEEVRGGNKIDLLRWDDNGELLAIGSGQSSAVQLYELNTRQIITLDISMGTKSLPTFMQWSKKSQILVVGTNQGSILIYNHYSSKKLPLMGKHQRAIITGDFHDDIFALGSDDLSISINSLEGETLSTISCTAEPTNMLLSKFRRSAAEKDKSELFLSYVVGHRTLSIVTANNTVNPISLQFQEKYGQIVETSWLKDGMIMIAFELGFLVVLSAHDWNDVNHELFSIQEFTNTITCIHANFECDKIFTGSDNGQVKVRSVSDCNRLHEILDGNGDGKSVSRVACSTDGSLVAVATETPAVIVYLTKIPLVYATYRNRVALLSSLTEVSIYEDSTSTNPYAFNAKLEPSVLAIGYRHIAVVFNNRVWYYEYKGNNVSFLIEEEYITTVKKVKINKEYVMVVMDQSVQIHLIIKNEDNTNSKKFPEDTKDNERVLHADLMDKFFVFATDKNRLRYFSLSDWGYSADYRHSRRITSVYGEPNGIRTVFFDDNYDAYLYHPSDDEAYPFHDSQTNYRFKSCFWESFTVDKDSLVLTDHNNIYAFVVSRNSHGEQSLAMLGTTKIPPENIPLSLCKGIVTCYTANEKLNTLLLNTHKSDVGTDGKNKEELFELLAHSISLKRWRNAWRLCDKMNDNKAWNTLGEAAVRDLNMELAIRVYRRMAKPSMVMALEAVKDVEEENLLSGHVMTLLGEFDKADELFCLSTEPWRALEMRRNILDWDRALQLANEVAKDQLPFVSLEYATQLDFMGQYSDALQYYEDAYIENEDSELLREHNMSSLSGQARMLTKLGEVQRGLQIATQLPDRQIKRECGMILEQMKLFSDAATIFEHGQYYDRAAVAYIKSKNWMKILTIEDHIKSPKVLTQYGKLLLADKRYEHALRIFEKARSHDNVVMILLRHMNKVDEAVKIARECRSLDGLKLIAKFFTDVGNDESAIEFLVLSQCFQEAYNLALTTKKMEVYSNMVESHGSTSQFLQLADYYDAINMHAEAGRFFGLAKEYETALNHLIKAGEDEGAIMDAVDFTAQSNNSILVDRLVHHLMGDTENVPKDPKFLFHLYTKLGMHAKAAQIALIIAKDQQNRGSYKSAHKLLFAMRQQLKDQKIYVPMELEDWLLILHSYILAKRHVTLGNHLNAARLLIRVSENVSRFSQHAVQILTSTVITCAKANLRKTAYELALKLIKPGYREKLDKKYKKNIETIVRKADNVEDPPEIMTSCPHCGHSVREFDLLCDGCKNTIPYCLVTGKHIIDSDFSLCSSCKMPGFCSELQKLERSQEACLMCQSSVGSPVPINVKLYLNVEEKK
ncbi:unnamed protein product [Bursaphelenchus okinawaensis]|uniref:C2H2-type domain-containing protein n=1 Tax=Bursaphelenchus okinawaensis TaxID=465554 RepID=A0A811KK95_9BILA|nr:unnamed protein product [Bursaphelenchus okinawaensis]CAG9104249.1 unnamed protein product [Bursaphelenchus okinawaensis]